MTVEELIEQLESVANFLRGMCFDPRLPAEIKEAVIRKYEEIDKITEDCS